MKKLLKFKQEIDGQFSNLLDIEFSSSKIYSAYLNEGGGTLCMGLPASYNSSYYKEANQGLQESSTISIDNSINSKITGINCGSDNTFGSNFTYSEEDFSIRLSDNNDYCVTHRRLPNGKANKDPFDENNFLFLSECRDDLSNQQFTNEISRLKTFSDGGREDNACVTMDYDKTLRLEECGDDKFTALHISNDNDIIRDDKCMREQAEDTLKKIGTYETCEDKSYWVIYLEGIFKREEHCSKDAAMVAYEGLINSIGERPIEAVIIVHKGKITNQSKEDLSEAYKLEAINVSKLSGECLMCSTPSKMLCRRNKLESSPLNLFNSFEDEQRLNEYCITMRKFRY